MRDVQLQATAGLRAEKPPDSEAQAHVAILYWNPCLGMPPITVESPLLFFGIQIAAGLIALAVLLIDPARPSGQSVGVLP